MWSTAFSTRQGTRPLAVHRSLKTLSRPLTSGSDLGERSTGPCKDLVLLSQWCYGKATAVSFRVFSPLFSMCTHSLFADFSYFVASAVEEAWTHVCNPHLPEKLSFCNFRASPVLCTSQPAIAKLNLSPLWRGRKPFTFNLLKSQQGPCGQRNGLVRKTQAS